MSITVGSVSVDVVPDARQFATRLRAGLVPEASRVGDDVGKAISDRIEAKVGDALPKGLAAGSRTASAQGGKAGEDFGGSFAQTARKRIEAALSALPKPQVGVDATELDAELADIRARLAALHDVRVGVDLRADEALAEMTALQLRLDELGARSPDINVKVDAAKAAAELAAVQAEVDHLDGKDVNIDVNDHGSAAAAEAGMSSLMTAGIALGPAIIPVAAAVAAAVAGIGAGALAAIGGLGVLALGFSGISGAVKELTQSQAQNGAVAARTASQQVSSAAAVANAEQQVADAHRAVGDAERQAALSVQQALQQQQNAEVSLADAQRAARQAQLDLNDARVQAKQNLEDLTNAVKDGALQQRQAVLSVEQARQNLNATLMNPQASALQRQQAQLTYDQAVQQLTDVNVRQTRLVDQQKAAAKAGVNGSSLVQQAQDRVRQSEEALVRARQSAANASAAVVRAQQQGAESVARAQERVIQAERQLQVAHAQAASAAEAGYAKTKGALAALSPVGQAFARFVAGSLIPLFHRIRDAAQAGLLPGLQAGLEAMLPVMPALTQIVSTLATTMGDLFREAGQALNAPFWKQFFQFIGSTIGPNLRLMGETLGNFATGFAGLFQAFAPVATQFGVGLAQLSGRFAAFGKSAGSNPAFQHFLAYVQKVGPQVMATLGALVQAFGHIVAALAPIGPVVLTSLGTLAKIITSLPTWVIRDLAVGIIALVVGIQLWTAAMAILGLVLDASPIGLLIAAIVLLVIGIVEAYRHSETFRKIVQAAFHAVIDVAKHVGESFAALWRGIVAAMRGIWNAVKDVFGWLKAHWPLLLAIITGPIGLATYFVVKHWDSIKAAATGVWHWVRDRFNDMVGFLTGLPGRISKAASGMWNGIKDAFRSVLNTIIGWWDHLEFKLPKVHIPGTPYDVGGFTLGTPDIPYFAKGGLVTAATLGVVGEAGREAILPLDNPATMAQLRDALAPRHAQPLVGKIEINNPAPEPASRSLPRVLRSTAFQMGLAT